MLKEIHAKIKNRKDNPTKKDQPANILIEKAKNQQERESHLI